MLWSSKVRSGICTSIDDLKRCDATSSSIVSVMTIWGWCDDGLDYAVVVLFCCAREEENLVGNFLVGNFHFFIIFSLRHQDIHILMFC